MRPQLSIVMPAYNEGAVIADVVRDLTQVILDRLDTAELVVVDDASTDDTGAVLDRIAAADPRVRVIHPSRNRGHGPAVRTAIEASTGSWIFQIDSDGQQVPEDFWKLWQHRARADLVMGRRQIVRNGRHRVVVSLGARYVSRLLGCGALADVNVPFKLFRRELWSDLAPEMPEEVAVPSLLIALGAGVRGWRIQQVAIECRERAHGPSSVDVRRLIKLSSAACREALTFRRRLAKRPPRTEPAAGPPVTAPLKQTVPSDR